MNLKNIWGGNVGFKGVILVALVSLVVGLGISGSLDWLSPSRAVNLMGKRKSRASIVSQCQACRARRRLRPVVVNIFPRRSVKARPRVRQSAGGDDPFSFKIFRWSGSSGSATTKELGIGFCHRCRWVDSDEQPRGRECAKDRGEIG